MADTFEVIERAIGPVIEIEEHVPIWRMPSAFGRDYKHIAEYVKSQGAEVTGMPYARYLDMDWDVELRRGKLSAFISMLTKKWHFYAGMPSTRLIPGSGELKSTELKNQRYVRAIHKGSYKESAKTYTALYDWATAQGLAMQHEAFELYINDPQEVEEGDIETEILIPLKETEQ